MEHVALNPRQRHDNGDGTVEYLWELGDNRTIQSACFDDPTPGLRLSTQTGCSPGCGFCAAALRYSVRDLTAAEIIAQARSVDEDLRSRGIAKPWQQVHLSGMGEALLNYDNVLEAARWLRRWTSNGTVSVTTSGIVPGIYRLAEEPTDIQLRILLHATEDDARRKLIRVGREWNIADVLEAARFFAHRQGRRAVIDYVLVHGVNDTDDDARRLVDLLDPELLEVCFLCLA
ncbi:radical SAM protein [Kutzneria sp. CA-103260]|uniref:radical SAM protein n=1 Tax=Kutzneria sp. CA-103260 TaxID=2802641 RepID=UPI001BAD2326|nr:radical SAM protein [Kutzneria sp. CA-103260]QUQ68826.1 23S rRNA (adenine(2503)-C(2))-methyltransferase RlmN [Kutzneria sp. CA-103260]